jgi:hypothetical protein
VPKGQQLSVLVVLARYGWAPIGLTAWAGAPLRLVLTGFAAWGIGAYGTVRAQRAGTIPPIWIPLLLVAGIVVPLVGFGSAVE